MNPDELLPLTALADELGVSLAQIRRWSDTDRANGFPTPVEKLGKVKFYRRGEVTRWVDLWTKTKYYQNSRST